MHGFIALYLIACLDPANHYTCVSLPITDSTQAQPDGSEMTMMEEHQDIHNVYQFGGWSCRIGNKKGPDRGHA